MTNGTKTRDRFDSPLLTPIYWQASPNEPITCGRFRASFKGLTDNDSVCGSASVHFMPEQSIELTVPHSANQSIAEILNPALSAEALKLYLLDHGTNIDVFCKSVSEASYFPSQEPIQVFPRFDSVAHATFHLLNWPDFSGPEDYCLNTGQPPHQGGKRCGSFSLELDSWQIAVAGVGETASLVNALKESGGYAITHVGSIRRSDGSLFSTEQLEEVLVELQYFFSFALGCWCGPSLAVGFDSCGARVYEEWGLRRCDSGSWRGWNSWFDSRHSEFLGAALPGFHRLWSNAVWRRPLTEAIYWYMIANRGGAGLGVDAAILFTQAALELLSWTYCVLDRKMVSENAFKQRGLCAADKFRLLASSLRIPLDIPASLTSLKTKPGRQWVDSMDAITDVRNRLVHPSSTRSVPEGACYDAWRLSMWYIDLVLLRLCDYTDKYANRLAQRHVGTVESLP